jgi:hypothetical protein
LNNSFGSKLDYRFVAVASGYVRSLTIVRKYLDVYLEEISQIGTTALTT